ncbi:helix-turn-helix domain-containing protein [Microbacterium sp. Leaf179]|uniref:helix-turn-helix domain-containing protein n=1 Tax=Microbacterium sp. Leaf179 TaxID=1736288 RepID=UPI0006F310C9|nr:helix-turn-helix transcriptional regulator [Microbacterium sp. Leaf179]KQR85194.1 hypothetical protein ASF96_14760 [Microbacterium sp. Leaf179]
MVEIVETVGERIKRYRQMNKMSAQKLADATGLTRSIIANIESGRRSDLLFSELIALSEALRVAPAAIVFPVESPFSPAPFGSLKETVAQAIENLVGAGGSDFWLETPAGELTSDLLSVGRLLAASRSRLDNLRADIRLRVVSASGEEELGQIAVLLDAGRASEGESVRMLTVRSGDDRMQYLARQHDFEFERCAELEAQFRKVGGDPGQTPGTEEGWSHWEFG